MRHLGDITKVRGDKIPAVDCITGGSPCQDLSVAGKRTGLAGERSGLFMEQIRIIKEMRARDREDGRTGSDIRPRFMVWENVPGAFSTNKGEDFRAVLQETVKVVCPEAPVIPMPKRGWPKAGCLIGLEGKWSVAWRVHDAKFWGVPQRRKRIALVADFGGLAAPEVLFVRKSLPGDPDSREAKGEEATTDAERGPGTADQESGPIAFHLLQDPVPNTVSPCMGTGNSNSGQASIGVCYSAGFKAGNGSNARSVGWQEEISPSLAAEGGGNSVPSVCIRERSLFEGHGQGTRYKGPSDVCSTLLGRMGTGGNNTPLLVEKEASYWDGGQTCGTLTASSADQQMPDRGRFNCVIEKLTAVNCLTPWENQSRRIFSEKGTFPALTARETAGQDQQAVPVKHIVRRLTPLECERLQGYPDGWTDIGDWVDAKGRKRKTSDSIRYRSIGNSIALPFWQWLTRRISAQYDRPATLGSLFDGIGGFPYCWERCNGRGTAIWASEIDEFCIAVTERRINSPGIV